MKLIDKDGIEREVFLEVVKERIGPTVTWSDLKKPKKKDIDEICNSQCKHGSQEKTLVYDEYGPIFDFRYCFVCGASLGTV